MQHDFLLATMPWSGHLNPLRPIARALVERGHRVRWYTGDRFRTVVAETGATFVPMSPGAAHDDDLDTQLPGRAGLTGLDAMRFDFKHAFLDPAPVQAADLSRLVADEPTSAVIADFGLVGASLLHELTRVPWVSVGISPLTMPSRDTAPFGLALPPNTSMIGRLRNRILNAYLDRVLLRDVRAYNQMIRASVGLPRLRGPLLGNISPLLHLQNGIAELEYPRRDLPPQVHFVGELADRAADASMPTWWTDVVAATIPVVHVTQGTVADSDLDALVLPTIHALADEDVLVVASTGRHDPAVLGPLPANARVARFIPHGRLLAHTSVMVTNGGFGGVQAALAHGVPLVVAGDSEDKPEVAARVAWAGAGINVRTGRPSPAQVRDAVGEVLREDRFRRHAAALRDVYRKLDAGTESVLLIERVVESGRAANLGISVAEAS